MTVYTRREIRSLGEWSETLMWYAKGVAALYDLPITEKLSWRFLAAMHDFDEQLWRDAGTIADDVNMPRHAEINRYWMQCQHQTWYFFPWHRAYLLGFESILRNEIIAQGGPADWALPYWNYSDAANPEARKVPKEFLDEKMPDGLRNYLYVAERYGTEVRPGYVALDGLTDSDFTGAMNDPNPGMGGPRSGFSLDSADRSPGLIEAIPHGGVHVDVGAGGLMADPRTAALDPIFWLHHANIDRLWQVWLDRDPANHNPSESAWLDGPADRAFALLGSDGADIASKPSDMVSLSLLGYTYDNLADPFTGATRAQARMYSLRQNRLLAKSPAPVSTLISPVQRTSELIGANDEKVTVGVVAAVTWLVLAEQPRRSVAASFARAAVEAAAEPDRLFLKLEHIRGAGAGTLEVFIRGARGEMRSAGLVPLFGLDAASDSSRRHGGGGLTRVIEVTSVVDEMHATDGDLVGALEVHIDTADTPSRGGLLTVENISLYRVKVG